MAVSVRFKALAAVAATCTGIGGFALGLSYNERDSSFLVNAQLKDVLQPSTNLPTTSANPLPGTSLPNLFRQNEMKSARNEANNSPEKNNSSATLLPSTATVGPHRAGEIMSHGFPTTDCIRSRSDYVLAYDRKNRTALWVAEHLTPERLSDRSKVSRKLSEFKEDPSIHPYFRSSNDDYRGSGFDRGHLAAAGNHWINQESLDETFYLSNISPQVGVGFNRDAWNKLEQYTRSKTKMHANVFVMTGPLYLPSRLEDGRTYVKYQVIGPNNVAVPTHFFKALLCQGVAGDFHMECYVMPNAPIEDSVPLQAFQVPPDSVERAAGFLLFEGLPKSALKTLNGRKL